jgi:hypothetical protein
VGVTSLKLASGRSLSMPAVRRVFKGHIQTVFDTELVALEWDEVDDITTSES